MSDYDRLTVKEYAQIKRVTERTVRIWINEGKVNAERTAGEKGNWRILIARAS